TEESAREPHAGQMSALSNQVSPDYFRTFGIPVTAGRDFEETDRKSSALVFIVNQTLAKKFFGPGQAVGKRIATNRESGRPLWGEIVGVVGDLRQLDPGAEAKAEVYAPLYQTGVANGAYLALRTKPEPESTVTAIKSSIWSI